MGYQAETSVRYFNSVDVHPQLCHKRHQFIFFKVSLPFVLEKAKGTQNQPDFIVAQVFQIFPSFIPGERQGKTESAILYCCTFISSWRKTREQEISQTSLLHSK
jgi:hypothetical protein